MSCFVSLFNMVIMFVVTFFILAIARLMLLRLSRREGVR